MKNRLEQTIAYISPTWALKREKSSQILAAYEAASYGRMRSNNPYVAPTSANTETSIDGPSLLHQARELERNYDLASGALDMLVSRIVGIGLQTEPLICDKKGNLLSELNKEIKELWDLWLESPDITGTMSGGELQQLEVRSFLRDGGFFKKVYEGFEYPHTNEAGVPFSIGCYEYDFVPFYLDRELENGNKITQGIETSKFGTPEAYWMYPSHPGDITANASLENLTRQDKFDTYHLPLIKRIGQLRGITLFHPIFTRLEDIREYDKSERVAAKIAASATWQLLTDNDSPIASGLSPDDIHNPEQPDLDIRPGMVFDRLYPGQKLEMIRSDRPSADQQKFIKNQLHCAASGIRMPYSALVKEYEGSYSAERQAATVFDDLCQPIFEIYKRHWHRTTYKRFLKVIFLYRLVKLYPQVDTKTLFQASHRGPGMLYIDPSKEATAKETLLRTGLESRSGLIRKAGGNPTNIDRERKADQNREKELGLAQPMSQNSSFEKAQNGDNKGEKEEEEENNNK